MSAGIDVVPNLPKCPVPVFDVVQNIPKFPVPVLMLYRTYRSVWYRYLCRTELTEVSSTGNTGGIYRRYASLRTVPNTPWQNCIHTHAEPRIAAEQEFHVSLFCVNPLGILEELVGSIHNICELFSPQHLSLLFCALLTL